MQLLKARLRRYFPYADGKANPLQWFAIEHDGDVEMVCHGPFNTRKEVETAIDQSRRSMLDKIESKKAA